MKRLACLILVAVALFQLPSAAAFAAEGVESTLAAPVKQCSDGIDNDGDGLVDYPADPQCSSVNDNNESPDPECSDEVDNDGDGKVDYPADLGCTDKNDNSESPDPPQCSDGVDNDGDGKVDYPADLGCTDAADNSESPDPPQCSDGVDNDGDGLVDFGSDPNCADAEDNSEAGGPGNFTCRASLVRVSGDPAGPLAAVGTVEPVVANADNDPCASDSATTGDLPSDTLVLPSGLGSVRAGYATTRSNTHDASSGSGAADVVITVPGAPEVRVEAVESAARVTCVNGEPHLASESTVTRLTVGSTTFPAIAETPRTVVIPNVGTLYVNQQTTSSSTPGGPVDTITQRAVFLDTGVADVVVAESVADFRGTPC